MQEEKFSDKMAGFVGTSESERGTRLGILAGGVALLLLFGEGALLPSATTVDFDQGQYTGLLGKLAAGYLALLFALILAYFAGLSAPEAKTGEPTNRAGMLAGALTMLLYWVAQTIFALVDNAHNPQGLKLDVFFRDDLIRGVVFFVIGGLFGWWGYRNAARRARSILSPPGIMLASLPDASTLSTPPLRPQASAISEENADEQPASVAESAEERSSEADPSGA
jgi:hypothetical protein